jgi:hypothetical protein
MGKLAHHTLAHHTSHVGWLAITHWQLGASHIIHITRQSFLLHTTSKPVNAMKKKDSNRIN